MLSSVGAVGVLSRLQDAWHGLEVRGQEPHSRLKLHE
jgi:hypothetical protein